MFIAKDSPMYAGPVVARFLNRAEALPDQPGQGRRVPEYQGALDLREVFVHRWQLIYGCQTVKLKSSRSCMAHA
jgi:toxin ParE1/3/4